MKPAALFFLLIPLPLFLSCTACSLPFGQENTQKSVSILSWNVQNLFDDVSNGGEYKEFDPNEGEWTTFLFRLRLKRFKEVLDKSFDDYPEILLLQEVENQNVLDVLTSDFLKKKYSWRTLVEEEGSTIHTAVLSSIPITSITSVETGYWGQLKLRPITEIHFDLDSDELVLFNNHWKSRSGGVAATEEGRIIAAQVLSQRIGSLVSTNPHLLIAAAGDFNENHDEYKKIGRSYRTAIIPAIESVPSDWSDSLYTCSKGKDSSYENGKLVLYSPWYDKHSAGSYVFKSQWSKIDHFFLWKSLFDGQGFEFDSFEVIKEDFLLNDYSYPDRWDTYREEGYSDHLPILLRISNNDL